MAPATTSVDHGRRDADRESWPAVHRTLTAARERAQAAGSDLDLADLDRLREAAWWLGRTTEAMQLDEEIYHDLEARGDSDGAARRALDLALQWALRGDDAVAGAWLGRARRLLAEAPPSATWGFLRYAEAAMTLDVDGDPRAASAAATELAELSRTYGEPVLACFARVVQGLAEVIAGRVQAGLDALDEAMLDVLAGRLPPLWAGDIFCTVIHVSHRLGDPARMRAWTRSLERWATPLSRTFVYAGVTHLHQLELAGAQGDWDRVEREMAEESEGLIGTHNVLAGLGFHELGQVRRLRGDYPDAAAAFARARELGTEPQPGEALLALALGRPEEAVAQLRLALSGTSSLERTQLLLPTVQAALAVPEVELAQACAADLVELADSYRTPALRAAAAHATGLLALRRGDGPAGGDLARDRPHALPRAGSAVRHGAGPRGARPRPSRPRRRRRCGGRPCDRARRLPAAGCTPRRRAVGGRLASRRPHRPGGGGPRLRRGRRDQPGGRGAARHQREDGQPPPRQHLRQARGRVTDGSRGLGARARHTPNTPHPPLRMQRSPDAPGGPAS